MTMQDKIMGFVRNKHRIKYLSEQEALDCIRYMVADYQNDIRVLEQTSGARADKIIEKLRGEIKFLAEIEAELIQIRGEKLYKKIKKEWRKR